MSKSEKELKALKIEAQRIMDQATKKVEHRVVLMNSLAYCLDILVNDIDQALTFTDTFGRLVRAGMKPEQKTHFLSFTKKLKDASVEYEQYIKSQLEDTAGGDFHTYEGYRQDANEILRIIMLYIDRIGTNDEATELESRLRAMPEGEFFPNSIVDRFNFKVRK